MLQNCGRTFPPRFSCLSYQATARLYQATARLYQISDCSPPIRAARELMSDRIISLNCISRRLAGDYEFSVAIWSPAEGSCSGDHGQELQQKLQTQVK